MPRVQVVVKARVGNIGDIDVLQHGACGWNVWFRVTLNPSLASYLHFKIAVNLNRHVSTARGAQPQIFVRAGFASVFQFRSRAMPSRGCFEVDQVEPSFAEVAKHR